MLCDECGVDLGRGFGLLHVLSRNLRLFNWSGLSRRKRERPEKEAESWRVEGSC
jgi:hypothetical protein